MPNAVWHDNFQKFASKFIHFFFVLFNFHIHVIFIVSLRKFFNFVKLYCMIAWPFIMITKFNIMSNNLKSIDLKLKTRKLTLAYFCWAYFVSFCIFKYLKFWKKYGQKRTAFHRKFMCKIYFSLLLSSLLLVLKKMWLYYK